MVLTPRLFLISSSISKQFRSLIKYSFVKNNTYSLEISYFFKLSMANNRYCIDLAKRGTAGCKNCKQKIEKGLARIGIVTPNPFNEGAGDMKSWYHIKCVFEKLSRARATTKKIESTDDLEGWDDFPKEHHDEVLSCISEFASGQSSKKAPPKKTPAKKKPAKETEKKEEKYEDSPEESMDEKPEPGPDDTFRQFRKICTELSNNPKYTEKTNILSNFFSKGSNGESFRGDLYLWVKMLLPAVEKRIYNLQTTQLIKIFSKIFEVSQEEMTEDYENGEIAGDVSETIRVFFEQSKSIKPIKKSVLYLQEVDEFLENLSKTGQEVEQTSILKKVAKKCTSNDLKYFVRFIKHDLRINAGPKPILGALNPNAYEAFQASRDLKAIVKRSMKSGKDGDKKQSMDVKTTLMTPVLPMLAMACKDLDIPFKKYPEGFYVEIKYDGERVQLHKKGSDFSYFSRSLKPVMPHKVLHLKDYIPKAFPFGNDLMLDCEILLIDSEGKPLPFGTLGAHKKTAFKDASVCLFVFDCLQFNDENLMNKTLVERRKILEENMKPVKNHVMFSELKEIKVRKDLQSIVDSIIDQGLEGLVIKAKDSVYEPGKRHWLKVKKDYLKDKDGKGMADSADLVVLGGYYGTGRKGGIMSVFLMGCYNEKTRKWCTVTKVPGGDDEKLDNLQKTLKMRKITKDMSNIPSWLNINKGVIPDFITEDPKDSPVWEISGAEFSKAEIHTASGISIRFPRIKRERTDKTWETATTLEELKYLFEASKVKSEIVGLKGADEESDGPEDLGDSGNSSPTTPSPKKVKEENQSKPKKTKKESNSESPKKIKESQSKPKKLKKEPSSESYEEKSKENGSSQKKLKRKTEADSPPTKKKKLDASHSSNSEEKSKSESSKGLPDVFRGVKLQIPDSIEKADVLRRYFIAYGGVVLKGYDTDDASHVIYTKDSSYSNGAVQVTVDWLWDSIKLQKTLPTKPYKPKS